MVTRARARRARDGIREQLLEAALVEFGAKGFDAASTRSIAKRVDAHQPQINYHFESKQALWTAAVNHLFGLLGAALADADPQNGDPDDIDALADRFADGIRRFVRFAAEHPQLNQIIVHEATASSDRLEWMTHEHVKPLYDGVRGQWRRLREAGIAAPIDEAVIHYVLVGAASLPYVNAPEARLLTGREPTDPDWVEAHAEGLVATLLPKRRPRRRRPSETR
jgi:AcrR family transcriptional regulator